MITPNRVLEAWRQACAAQEMTLWEAWDDGATYTNHVLYKPDSVLKAFAASLALTSYAEYYCLDAVLFQDDDLVPGRPEGQTWLRRIRLALEHENYFNSGLFQEISHLLITDCDFRVLVAYPPPKCDPNAELNRLHAIVRQTDRAPQVAATKSLMIILGTTSEETARIKWRGLSFTAEDGLTCETKALAQTTKL